MCPPRRPNHIATGLSRVRLATLKLRQEFVHQCHARTLKPIDSVTNFLMMNAGMPAASPSAHSIW